MHAATRIGRHVILMPGVVIGRADSWIPPARVAHLGGRVVIGDDVTLGAGAKVLYEAGQELIVAEGTIVGANAVLRDVDRALRDLGRHPGTPRRTARAGGCGGGGPMTVLGIVTVVVVVGRLADPPALDPARRRRDGRLPADRRASSSTTTGSRCSTWLSCCSPC